MQAQQGAGHQDGGNDADARDGTGRRAHQTRHVTASRSDQKAEHGGKQHAQQAEPQARLTAQLGHVLLQKAADHKVQHGQRHQTDGQHPAARHVLVGITTLGGHLFSAMRALVANGLKNGPRQRAHRPQSRDTNHTSTQKAGLGAPQLSGQITDVLARSRAGMRREPRDHQTPAQHQPCEHGDPRGGPHQVTRRQQCGRKACRHTKSHAPRRNPEIEGIAQKTQTTTQKGKQRRQTRAPAQITQTAGARSGARHVFALVALCIANAQHLGSGHAFGVRQVGLHHHHPAQRYGVEHAQCAACRADQGRLPEGKPRPQAQHEQCGQHKNHRRERARRRRLGLNQVVLQNIGVLEAVQQRHGDHRRRNGGGKGQPHFEAQVHIGRRKRQGDQRSQNDATQCEFTHRVDFLMTTKARAGKQQSLAPAPFSALLQQSPPRQAIAALHAGATQDYQIAAQASCDR